MLTTLLAYSNIAVNPLIYIYQYDVVRTSLVNFMRKIAAKFKRQQPPTATANQPGGIEQYSMLWSISNTYVFKCYLNTMGGI